MLKAPHSWCHFLKPLSLSLARSPPRATTIPTTASRSCRTHVSVLCALPLPQSNRRDGMISTAPPPLSSAFPFRICFCCGRAPQALTDDQFERGKRILPLPCCSSSSSSSSLALLLLLLLRTRPSPPQLSLLPLPLFPAPPLPPPLCSLCGQCEEACVVSAARWEKNEFMPGGEGGMKQRVGPEWRWP